MAEHSTDIAGDGLAAGEAADGGTGAREEAADATLAGDPGALADRSPLSRRAVTPLSALPHGVRARVVAVEGEGAVALRLMEMGVVPGAPVRVIKAAPLGDPVEVRVRGYHLALRRSEAQAILVTSDDS